MKNGGMPDVLAGYLVENIENLRPDHYYAFLNIAGNQPIPVPLEDPLKMAESIDRTLSTNPSGVVSTKDGMSHTSAYPAYYYALGSVAIERLSGALGVYNAYVMRNAPKVSPMEK